MSRTALGVGLIGFGYAARTFHLPLITATPGLAVLRAAVRSDEAAKAVEAAGLAPGSIEAVLADPAVELVVVATPTADHAEHAAIALEAGKHVTVDKPLAGSAADAERLLDLAARRSRVLSVFHNRRWDSDFLSLRAVLESGALGHLVELSSAWDRFRPVVRDRWRERPGPGGGVWRDLGSHLVDQALQLFGQPASILADIGGERAGARAPDRFHVRLAYPDGLRVVLESRSLALAPAPRFVAHGTKGSFVKRGLDPQEAALAAGGRPGDPGWGIDPEPGVLIRQDGGGARETAPPSIPGDYGAFYPALRDAIVSGRDPPVRADEALAVLRILELAEQSACEGRAVSP